MSSYKYEQHFAFAHPAFTPTSFSTPLIISHIHTYLLSILCSASSMSFTKLVTFVTLALATGVLAAPVSERQIDIPVDVDNILNWNDVTVLKVGQTMLTFIFQMYLNKYIEGAPN
jgi:hypothetical protein